MKCVIFFSSTFEVLSILEIIRMPYDPTNEHEETAILVTDTEALEVIEQEKKSWLEVDGSEMTTEDILEWWRSDPYVLYMVVDVKDGKATGDLHFGAFEILGKARAAAWNFFLEFRREYPGIENTLEIRKHTGSKRQGAQAQKAGDTGKMGCWHGICLSIELVDTIKM